MDKKIGYGVLGLGVGRAHADAVVSSEHGRLLGVCDINRERLDDALASYPGVAGYDSFDKMLENPEIELISICLPSGMHAEYAVRALKAGKHVLVEKPMDISPDRAQLILDAAKEYNKKVGCVFQNRNNACMKPIKSIVESGRLGKIYLATFAVKWYREQEYYDNGGWRGTWEMDGGGSLMNQSIHSLDLMLWLLGDIESVSAEMAVAGHNIKTEDLTASLIRFKSGAVGTFVTTTCAYPGISTDIQIYGTRGSVEAEDDRLTKWKIEGADDNEEKHMLDLYGEGNVVVEQRDGIVTGHSSSVWDMIDAVYYGRDPQVMPGDGIRAVRAVRVIYEAAGKKFYN